MYSSPSSTELLQAVKTFIDGVSKDQLTGHAKFHARVAMNVLDTVMREIEQRPEAEASEHKRLLELLNTTPDADTDALNHALGEAIRTGVIELDDAKLRDHLKRTTIAQLLIDQPRYSGLDPA
jgi:hypothetical protein